MKSQTLQIQSLGTNTNRYGSFEFWLEIVNILENLSKNIDELSEKIK